MNGYKMIRTGIVWVLALLTGLLGGTSTSWQSASADDGAYLRLASGGVGGWLNTDRPLTVADMKGKIVLLDFWTYGCVNCMQVVPDLKVLEEKFGDNLVVIGVHSAKYKGEGDSERILAAAKRFGITHPVINDYDFSIWKGFAVNAWPTFVVLGANGDEITRASGEGQREFLSRKIAAALPNVTNKSSVARRSVEPSDLKTLSFPARIKSYKDKLVIADSGHNRILITTKDGTVETVIGSGRSGLKDGSLSVAEFNHPRGMTIFGDKMYVADTDNHAIRLVDLQAQKVTTVVGNGSRGFDRDVDSEDPLKIALASPWDITAIGVNEHLNFVIASAGLHQIHIYDPVENTVKVFAGSGAENIKDGASDDAALAQTSALSERFGKLYFVDAETSSLRVIDGGTVKTLVGTGLFDFGLKDGTYTSALMQHPQGLYASDNTVLIADTYNNAIREYDLASRQLSTWKLAAGSLEEPGDIVAISDKIYVADTGHNRIVTVNKQSGKVEELTLIFADR